MLVLALKLAVVALVAGVATRVLIALSPTPWLGRLVGRLYFTRYAWLPAVALVVLCVWVRGAAPNFVGSLFVVSSGGAFAVVGFLAVLAGVTVVASARVIWHNAPVRFPDYRAVHAAAGLPYPPWSVHPFPGFVAPQRVWIAVGGFVVLVVGVCLLDTPTPADRGASFVWSNAGWAAAGAAVALAALVVLAWVEAHTFLAAERLPNLFLFRFVGPVPRGPSGFLGLAGAVVRYAGAGLGPGYARRARVLTPGHGQLALLTATLAAAYLGLVAAEVLGRHQVVEDWLPPIATVLGLATAFALVAPAVGFYLDYHRIPAAAAVLVSSGLLFLLTGADHDFYVDADHEPPVLRQLAVGLAVAVVAAAAGVVALVGSRVRVRVAAGAVVAGCLAWAAWWPSRDGSVGRVPLKATPTLVQLTEKWEIPPALSVENLPPNVKDTIPAKEKTDRVLVVIAASGGGIQASAWTARVLTGLHERYGQRFSRSVRLISGVSGGSLGTAAFLSRWDTSRPQDQDPFPNGTADMEAINLTARRPGLAAASWGLAGPDLLRFGFPAAVPGHYDRGRALETRWHAAFRPALDDWRLRHLGGPARDGRAPVVVFNAVQAETGRRLLIGSNTLNAGLEPSPAGVEFLHLFPHGEELRVATAVRLSATFPFVSPISRARSREHYDYSQDKAFVEDRSYPLHTCHVVDGGYVDNGGVVTAAQAIEALLDAYDEGAEWRPGVNRPFDSIVLIRIIPFPVTGPSADEVGSTGAAGDAGGGASGWLNEFTGPVVALANVRTSSQLERNTRLVHSLRVFAQQKGGVRLLDVPVHFVRTRGAVTPLSWSLTRGQEEDIDDAWALVSDRRRWADLTGREPGITIDAIQKLDDLFGPPPAPAP